MPTENWPPHEQQQLGGALSQLNATLLQRVSEIQGHNLGECVAGLCCAWLAVFRRRGVASLS